MDQIRLGTIGSGNIVRSVLNNAVRTDGITLAAVYSRSADKGAALASAYGCSKVYTDMAEFLADTDVNTVYIATPNLLHYEQTKRALLAGKHVITEKPFTPTFREAEELASIAKARGLMLVEAAPTGFLPNFEVLQQQLPKIGRIRLVMSNYSQYSARYDLVLRGEKPAIFDPAFAGGCLMDINYYNVLLNVLLFGAPESAVYHANVYPGLADTSGVMLLQYGDFISTNAGAKDTAGENFFQIEGELGHIYIERGSNGIRSVRVVTKEEDRLYNEQPEPDRLYYEMQAISRLFRDEDHDDVYARLARTLTTVRIVEEARKAAGILFPCD